MCDACSVNGILSIIIIIYTTFWTIDIRCVRNNGIDKWIDESLDKLYF